MDCSRSHTEAEQLPGADFAGSKQSPGMGYLSQKARGFLDGFLAVPR